MAAGQGVRVFGAEDAGSVVEGLPQQAHRFGVLAHSGQDES
jgi:hypothetical protein